MRRGVLLLGLVVVAASFAASSARADGTTTTDTTTPTTTTSATTTTPAPSYGPLSSSYLSSGCVGAGDAAIAPPGGRALMLGTPAVARGASGYPTTSPVVAFAAASGGGSSCRTGHVTLESVSLFGGYVTASSVSATRGNGTVSGLVIGGQPVSLGRGGSALVGFWGQLTLGKTVGRITAPLVVLLLKRHWNLPAGTTVAVGFSAAAEPAATHPTSTSKTSHHPTGSKTSAGGTGSPQPSKSGHAGKKHKKKHFAQPLTTTPPLGFRPSHYVFPVDGGASYGDTYGGVRNDIYDGWHHGDDLFASLGTPIVAVANGKLSLVGWNRLGGWRLWLTDADGNSFYYAHLAGYSRWILKHPNVRAGQVVGFLGRTGDAFTTAPHLHFEIHPHQYLKLGYDGAVDPTAYLQKWRLVHVPAKEMPNPATLKAPVGTPAQEAAVVWHELLVARHLLHASAPATPAKAVTHPFPNPPTVEASGIESPRIAYLRRTAAHVPATADMTPWLGGGISGAAVIVALSAGAFTFRRRRRAAATETPSVPDAG
ncbi:MAG TPA: M23 family metallopeptidase [Gaiellaceae bacterium]|nr:M23 family metallopeptidase [Gaiellaceae bacterium]